MYYSVGILRFAKGLDYSTILGDDMPKSYLEVARPIVPTDSTADLKIHGSLDSLSRNESQGELSQEISNPTSFLLNPWHNY